MVDKYKIKSAVRDLRESGTKPQKPSPKKTSNKPKTTHRSRPYDHYLKE